MGTREENLTSVAWWHEMVRHAELVTIASFPDSFEASLAKGALEAAAASLLEYFRSSNPIATVRSPNCGE